MGEQKDKTLEQVSDEDYKVAPTSADERHLNKRDMKKRVTGESYPLLEEKVQQELRGGVE
ncbi:hypothetical protein Ngar_c05530 [Candidatus Nitrososphaera gargensis Ga9.2]|uniref:Uncharacterized protein n=1 Tax=Nitrososphaera gargensis (strain Ga9.2) TaxID=1237085 RepID=K0I898_NITGG|nr:hypothetical protein [Candidatus Nitrososphaera gargensis]AFU57496.1 hypothetical protein Ngar_c05530 [Candidatus Nitrososphaera gargensis Ga9.2]